MKIRIAITDERMPRAALLRLSSLGFFTVTLPPFSRLGDSVASHTDMLILKADNTFFTYADFCEENPHIFDTLYELLSKSGASFRFLADEVKPEYPDDAKINVLVIGKHVFAREASVCRGVLSHFESLGYRTVNVKQGYPACTVLKISDNTAVTADRGMAKSLEKAGIQTVLIEEGHIALPPHEYGFIGGCAGRIGNCIYFSGRIEDHPSYKLIKEAAEREGVSLISLGDFPLLDVGGIIFAEYDLDENCKDRN